MSGRVSLDGRTLVGVANDEDGEVSGDTRFQFTQDGEQIYARYSGGTIVDGHYWEHSMGVTGTSDTYK